MSMFICMTPLSMFKFSRLNQRKMFAVFIGDVLLGSDVMGAGGGGPWCTPRAPFSLVCACVGLVIKPPQERRPDVAPQGRVGNE